MKRNKDTMGACGVAIVLAMVVLGCGDDDASTDASMGRDATSTDASGDGGADAGIDDSGIEPDVGVDAGRDAGEEEDALPSMDGGDGVDAFVAVDAGFGGCSGMTDGDPCGPGRICVTEVCALDAIAVVSSPDSDTTGFARGLVRAHDSGVVISTGVSGGLFGPGRLYKVDRDGSGSWLATPYTDFAPSRFEASYWGKPLAASDTVIANSYGVGDERYLITMVRVGSTWSSPIETIFGSAYSSALAVDEGRVIAARGTSSSPVTGVFRVTAAALQPLTDLPSLATAFGPGRVAVADGLVVTSNYDGVHALRYDPSTMSYAIVDTMPLPSGSGREVATDGRFVVTWEALGILGPVVLKRFELVGSSLEPAGVITLPESFGDDLGPSIAIDGAHVLAGAGGSPFPAVVAYVNFDTGAVEALGYPNPRQGASLLWYDGLAIGTTGGTSSGVVTVHDVGR